MDADAEEPVPPPEKPVSRRWRSVENILAVIAVLVPPLAYGYVQLGEHDPRMHLLGWTIIVHHDHSMAVWTPGNRLLAMDFSGFGLALVIGSVLYLLARILRAGSRAGRRVISRVRHDPRRGFPMD